MPPITPVTNANDGPITQSSLDKSMSRLEGKLDTYAQPIGIIFAGMIVVLFLGFVATLVSMGAMLKESYDTKTAELHALNENLEHLNAKLNPTTIRNP